MLLTAIGASVGVRRGLPTLWGVVCGFVLMVFVITLGLGNLAVWLEEGFAVMRIGGLAVLGWLAWHIATAPVETSSATDSADSTDRVATQARSARDQHVVQRFVGALLFQWVNPKAWLVITSASSAYLQSEAESWWQSGVFALVFGLACIISAMCWLVLGSWLRHWLCDPVRARLFNVVMAVLLVISMVPLLL